MDELYAVHPYAVPGPITSFPDGTYAYTAEGGAVALLWSDPTQATPQNSYDTPIWRVPVGSLGVNPVEMILDPDMDFTDPLLNEDDPNAWLYIAAGRDGLWALNANTVPPTTSGPTAIRIDDSGDTIGAQDGRRWCNDVKFMEVNGKRYLLALFGGTADSILRVYDMLDVDTVVNSGLETGAEITRRLEISLQQNASVVASNASSRAFGFGMAVDENEGPVGFEDDYADVYVAMGEHGIYRVPLKWVSNALSFDPIEFGPWFGAGSPYETHESALYGNVVYYDLEHNAPNTVTYQHCPYFLDVAVEDAGENRHRLYATVDHLGWVAFNLDAPWDDDIYSTGGTNGFPDFLQEGKRYDIIDQQPKKQIRLIDDITQGNPEHLRQTSARHLEVVETRDSDGQNQRSTLVVSVSARRFLIDPGNMNDGRTLNWDISVGQIRFKNYPPKSHGSRPYILSYDLTDIGNTSATPPWTNDCQHYRGWSLGGWDLHVPEQQKNGELHYFYGENVSDAKTVEDVPGVLSERNLSRVWYAPWPPASPQTICSAGNMPPTHTGFVTRDRFHRLGRFVINFGPSKLDPRVLVTAENDGGIVPDGPLVIDPATGEITSPFATPGATLIPPTTPLNNLVSAPPGASVPSGQATDLTYGILMDPRGGFVAPSAPPNSEYRIGHLVRYIGTTASNEHYFPYAWLLGKYGVGLGTQGEVNSITEKRVYITPPANKFSVAPYSGETLEEQVAWSGRPYYSLSTTFEEYNAYVAANFSMDVDPDGLVFSTVNGSPTGLWALGMSKVQGLADDDINAPNNLLVKPDNFHSTNPNDPGKDMIIGGLVTHPEYWNITDVRTVAQPPEGLKANYFIQNSTGHSMASVQAFSPDMFRLPDPTAPHEPEDPVPHKWVLAVPCGHIAFPEDEPQISAGQGWEPDAPEFTTAGFHHMMVRLFDMSDPSKLVYVNPLPNVPKPPNNDSPLLQAYTLIGQDQNSGAFTVRGLQVPDTYNKNRYFMLVGDLGGRVYLYDVENLLDPQSTQVTHHAGQAHYGRFFTDAPLVTYQTQQSMSDSEPNGVFGMEVVHEPLAQGSPTYIYLAVWRVGVEVLELGFDCTGSPPVCIPTLNYLGHIQTPGATPGIFVKEFPSGSGFPSKLLYVSDYTAGLRIYKHP